MTHDTEIKQTEELEYPTITTTEQNGLFQEDHVQNIWDTIEQEMAKFKPKW